MNESMDVSSICFQPGIPDSNPVKANHTLDGLTSERADSKTTAEAIAKCPINLSDAKSAMEVFETVKDITNSLANKPTVNTILNSEIDDIIKMNESMNMSSICFQPDISCSNPVEKNHRLDGLTSERADSKTAIASMVVSPINLCDAKSVNKIAEDVINTATSALYCYSKIEGEISAESPINFNGHKNKNKKRKSTRNESKCNAKSIARAKYEAKKISQREKAKAKKKRAVRKAKNKEKISKSSKIFNFLF